MNLALAFPAAPKGAAFFVDKRESPLRSTPNIYRGFAILMRLGVYSSVGGFGASREA